MMQNTILRPVTESDASQLRDLYSYSLQKNAAGFVQNPEFHGDIFARATAYQDNNGCMLGLFAEDDRTLLGFGGLKPMENNRVELCNLHVHPHQHGKGYGKYIALNLIDDARDFGYETLELHVTATQNAAIGLYKRLGFNETGRKNYDIAGASYDTIFMELGIG
ncbi:MAG: GNAT family N-acetyltransferase [Bdellovibrionales bacterium]|jgi:ribosomal protein S18 acetylase RimI-like enzyme|nr:GNAT family N-acetyltransferase [Bdellovibrionales bacterium]